MNAPQKPSWKNHMKGGVTKELNVPEMANNPITVPNSEQKHVGTTRRVVKAMKGVIAKNKYCNSGQYHGRDWMLETSESTLPGFPKVLNWTLETYSEYGGRNFVIETANKFPEIILALMNWVPFQDMLDKLDPDSDRFQRDYVESNINSALMFVTEAINRSKKLIDIEVAGMLK